MMWEVRDRSAAFKRRYYIGDTEDMMRTFRNSQNATLFFANETTARNRADKLNKQDEVKKAASALHDVVYSLPYTTQEVAEKIGVTRGHLYNCMSGGTSLSRSAEMLLMTLVEKKPRKRHKTP